MGQVNKNLPNGGKTEHFSFTYEELLSPEAGLNLTIQMMDKVEEDMNWIQNCFPGVNLEDDYPIYIEITGDSGGASWKTTFWSNLADNGPTMTIKPGPSPTLEKLRYLFVSEVTEMFMQAQGKGWYLNKGWFETSDEGSMGEALSRFLASKFIGTLGTDIPTGANVVPIWLNNGTREDQISQSPAPDDIQPDAVTGCGTCFLFYLHSQLNFSIQAIVAAEGHSLAEIYNRLTGESDAWLAFSQIVNDHYPIGTNYYPRYDNMFPVPELVALSAPDSISWVENGSHYYATAKLDRYAMGNIRIELESDNAILQIPPSVDTTYNGTVQITVPQQLESFQDTMVTISARYAGKTVEKQINVVRPENLPTSPLQIDFDLVGSFCDPQFIEGTSRKFRIRDYTAFDDTNGLKYKWTVNGAIAKTTDQATLTIDKLPPAGTTVTINVEVQNELLIRAFGELSFKTRANEDKKSINHALDDFRCNYKRFTQINRFIPPWVTIEIESRDKAETQLKDLAHKIRGQLSVASDVLKAIDNLQKALHSNRDAPR